MRPYCDDVRETRNVFFNFYIITTVKSILLNVHVSVCMRVTLLRKANNIYFPAASCANSRAHIYARNYISILHILCPLLLHARDERAISSPTPRWIISTDRTLACCATWCYRMSQRRPVGATRRGATRRDASRHKVSPSFPYLLPSLREHLRVLCPSPAFVRPPSRAINERVIDARSVNRLLPFINSPGRRAAAAAAAA